VAVSGCGYNVVVVVVTVVVAVDVARFAQGRTVDVSGSASVDVLASGVFQKVAGTSL